MRAVVSGEHEAELWERVGPEGDPPLGLRLYVGGREIARVVDWTAYNDIAPGEADPNPPRPDFAVEWRVVGGYEPGPEGFPSYEAARDAVFAAVTRRASALSDLAALDGETL